MPLLELLPDIFTPTFEMKVGGRPLEPDIAKRILQVSVRQTLGEADHFSFQVYDPELKLINATDGRFTEGQDVEISIGYVGNVKKMIEGKITALTADFPTSGPPTLQVDGFDRLHRMTRGTANRRFGDAKPDRGSRDSEIVSQIASEMNLRASVDETPIRTTPRVQKHVTNFAFLQELARLNGYFLRVEEGTLHFKREPTALDSISLEWGKTLLSFSPRFSTAGLVDAVVVRGWDPIQRQPLAEREKRSDLPSPEFAKTGQLEIASGAGGVSEIVIDNAPVSSAVEARTLAKAILSDLLRAAVTGSGACVGQPDLRVGTVLELSGIGRFDGRYVVAEATHTISDSGYQTSFQVNTAPNFSDLLSPSGADGSPDRSRNYGVTIGIVLDNKDPQGLGRVKVKLPGSSDEEIGHWARVATLMAGNQRGTFFLPEVNDEVLVAFENGEITRPYIVGALWNGRDKPPDTNADGKNNLRFIKSRSGHVVRLDDTDGKEKIEIVDKSGGNSVTIDTASDTITIKSAKDVVIEAPQGKISLSAKSIEVKSTAETKVEAQSTMDLKAGATMNIKGATVNIN